LTLRHSPTTSCNNRIPRDFLFIALLDRFYATGWMLEPGFCFSQERIGDSVVPRVIMLMKKEKTKSKDAMHGCQ
jgi:hypothetical protein